MGDGILEGADVGDGDGGAANSGVGVGFHEGTGLLVEPVPVTVTGPEL